MALMFSISGLRGIVGKDLIPDIITHYAAMFGEFIGPGKFVIGRDARKSGVLFRKAVIQGLNSTGCAVIDLGIVPTPTVVFMVKKLRAKGGIAITASHNPIQWNALKFISRKGQFLSQKEFKSFKRFSARKKMTVAKPKKLSKVTVLKNGIEYHIEKIIRTLRIKSIGLKIGVDAVNGAGSRALPRLLEKLGCEVYRINCKFSPNFPRKPEPTPDNIKQLGQIVKKKKLDLGFACDPDCDRLSIVDECGRAVGEENTLVLATDFILEKTRGNVVTNLSTTALMDYVTKRHNCKLHRTKVGEANVVCEMNRIDAIVGGEGNGGVIYPRINTTRDALVGAAIIVKLLNDCNRTVSEIINMYPKYYMVKKNIRMPREWFEKKKVKILKRFKGKVNSLDGLRIQAKDYWLHIRPSQTEPLIRIIGESRNKRQIVDYIRVVKSLLS
jgi:phosphomannomutase